ncbi:MAG: hypothetical protein QOH88_3530 [Verrucomicrobiota bacterium]|jgi:hypothetical protein
MIDIARAKLPGGDNGGYQIGRGMSGRVLRHFGLTADEFVATVAAAKDDEEVLAQLPVVPGQADHSKVSRFLEGLTVADVPADMRAQFEEYYGKNQPTTRSVLDVIAEDDARSFPRR